VTSARPGDDASDDSRECTKKRLKVLAPLRAQKQMKVSAGVGELVNADSMTPSLLSHGLTDRDIGKVPAQRMRPPRSARTKHHVHRSPGGDRPSDLAPGMGNASAVLALRSDPELRVGK
jgi:hypothetical protein